MDNPWSEQGEFKLAEYDAKEISLPYIITMQLDTIRLIASREFHKGIILYNDQGMVRNYLPDVLESYCNAIDNLSILLTPYKDNEWSDPEKGENTDKKVYWQNVYKACLMLLKRLTLLPDETTGIVEIAGFKRSGGDKDRIKGSKRELVFGSDTRKDKR